MAGVMIGRPSSHRLPEHRQSRPWWPLALLFLLGGSVITEAMPHLFGSGAAARIDWSFAYVTMKFVLLPGASLVVLCALLYGVLRRSPVPWQAGLAGLAALAYIVGIVLWPVAWLP